MPLIEIKDIVRTYKTGSEGVRALRGVSLSIEKGEMVSVMGASGSGKSTLMNILGCLDKADSGSYLLDGTDVSSLSKDELAAIRNRTLGFVFQQFHLLPRTSALENVELPLLYNKDKPSWKSIRSRAREALDLVGLSDREKHTPSELSGGQQQRVAIARALVTNPVLLLADEPTGNLDSRTSLEIMGIFQRLNENGLTVLMVTHEPDIAQFGKRTIVIRDGLIQADRSHKQHSSSEALKNWSEDDVTELTKSLSE